MTIISMATESYSNWLYHFLSSLEFQITGERIIIYMINFDKKVLKKFKKRFPEVEFVPDKRLLIQKDPLNKEVFKVTYLKGHFIERTYVKYGEAILWIDCTALIRSSPEPLLNQLDNLDTLLMRRDFGKDQGKKVYACEIFGMNDWQTIQDYRENCDKRKADWFSDQLALCEIKTENRKYIEFGEWSNFYYDQKANSWSDRGRTGSGILNKQDYDYTEAKYIEDLELKAPGYEKQYREFFKDKLSKPKILVHIDAEDWCYHTTVHEIADRLKDDFDFLIIGDAKKEFEKYRNWQGDLVWARCSSKRHQKMLSLRPDLRSLSFSTVTTGGETAEDRVTSQVSACKGEAGILCQNEDVAFRLRYKLKKLGRDQKIFILQNGVDTDKFKPGKNKNKEPVVGFVGRTRTYPEDFMKGYSTILKPVCEELDLKLIAATNDPKEVRDFKDMPEFYNKIDILVLLSHSEGHSNTINEAMASGIPVIAFPVGWHIENARSKIIWCQRSTSELLYLLEDCKSNFDYYRPIGQKSRDFAVEHLSWGIVAKKYRDTFLKMINEVKLFIPSKDKPVDPRIMGSVEIEYIAEDNGMNTQYGIFQRGKKYKLNPEAYNYFKNHFPNKFNFQNNE